jgi:hypothetical protein
MGFIIFFTKSYPNFEKRIKIVLNKESIPNDGIIDIITINNILMCNNYKNFYKKTIIHFTNIYTLK